MKRTAALFLTFIFSLAVFSVKSQALSAKSAVVINADSGEIIYGVNYDAQMPMASTTKIMTALILCENADMSKEITVTDEMVRVEGTSLGLKNGDRITYKDLLYGMMLSSGNDAANTIAISLGGSIDNFVDKMNERAKEMGLKNTHFNTPSGLDGNTHYTTAYELSLIAKKAVEHTEFCKAVSSSKATLYFGNPPRKITVKNHNKLLSVYSDVCGIKTGFTKKSGRCLVSMAKKDGKSVIAVTLNDKDDWKDHRDLLDIGLNAITVKEIKGISADVKTVSGEKVFINAFAENKSITFTENTALHEKVLLPSFVYCPVKKGQKIGKAILIKDNKEIFCRDIVSKDTVKPKKINKVNMFFDTFVLFLRSINEG